MRVALRASVIAAATLAFSAALGFAVTIPPMVAAVALAGTTILIMGGTGHPLSTVDALPYVKQYIGMAVDSYVSPASTGPAGIPAGPYNGIAVITPEEHAPHYGTLTLRESVTEGVAALDSCLTARTCNHNELVDSAPPSASDTFVVFGYSQSAVIAMLEKAVLADEYVDDEGPDTSFVTMAGPRPNGGLVARDTTGVVTSLLLGVQRDELITAPVRTDTRYPTVDVALQYDGFVDFPLNPWNVVATLNAYIGITLQHGAYRDHSLSNPGVLDQGQYGDTHYYLMPADILPLLAPLEYIPVIGHALADSWDPVLRVIVESGYDRSVSPGVPTPFDPSYSEDPARLARNILAAIPIGVDNGIEELIGVRPLGTERPGPYGVGGADGDPTATESVVANTAMSSAARDVSLADGTGAAGVSDAADDGPPVGPSSSSTKSDSTMSTTTQPDTAAESAQTDTAETPASEAPASEATTDGDDVASPSDGETAGADPGTGDRDTRQSKPSTSASSTS